MMAAAFIMVALMKAPRIMILKQMWKMGLAISPAVWMKMHPTTTGQQQWTMAHVNTPAARMLKLVIMMKLPTWTMGRATTRRVWEDAHFRLHPIMIQMPRSMTVPV